MGGNKVDVHASNTTIIRTLIFEWYEDLKIGTKEMCAKRDWTMCSTYMLIVLGSIVNKVEGTYMTA